MQQDYLDFEQPIAELDAKINELRLVDGENGVDILQEIEKLQDKSESLTKSIFSKLDDWQVVQLARHPKRPYCNDYISMVFTDFQELHGDRMYADDAAIVGGLARLKGRTVMVVGHQKGRDTKTKVLRNFGMPKPEGYRKALRLMHLAEDYNIPVVTFIDTPGAYPGIGAEERGQSEAIARNLYEMTTLTVPIIAVVTGEGGSGGALALGVADHVAMMQYSIYSVISPEGCASILWKSAEKASEAAGAMNLTASALLRLGLIDQVIEEPLGGAHRDYDTVAANLSEMLITQLDKLSARESDVLLASRYDKFMAYGEFKLT